MARDVVHIRATGRTSRVTASPSTYTGYATETGPVVDRINAEVDTTTAAPTNLVLSSDTLFNNVYIAATWDPVADTNVVGYQVVFARAGVSSTFRVETEAAWFEPAMGGEDYDVTVSNVYVNGVLGANTVTSSITAANDTSIPSTPSGLSLGVGIRSITVGWDENTEDDMQFGLGQYSVQLSNDGTFVGADIVHETIVGGLVASFSDLDTNTQYWARVAAVDTSGNTSAYTGALSGTTGQIVNDDIADSAIIGSAKIQNASIEDAQIIELVANKLIAGTGFVNELTVATGGAIKSSDYDAAPTVDGWYIGPNSAVMNNVTIRGTLSGVDGDFTGSLDVGSNNTSFHVNSTGNLWIGHASEGSAPFRVANDGTLTATSGTFSGSITGATGAFSGTMSASNLTAGTIEGIDVFSSSGGNKIGLESGDELTFYDGGGTPDYTISVVNNNLEFSAGSTNSEIILGTDFIELRTTSLGALTLDSGSDTYANVGSGSIFYVRDDSTSIPADRVFAVTGTAGSEFYRQLNTATDWILAGYSNHSGGSKTTKFVIETNGDFQNATGSYGSISDERLKDNIQAYKDPTADLMAIPVIGFDMARFSEEVDENGDPVMQDFVDPLPMVGWGAQSVEAVKPGFVKTSPINGLKTVKSSLFVPLLHRGFQVHNDRLDDLTSRLAAVEAQLA